VLLLLFAVLQAYNVYQLSRRLDIREYASEEKVQLTKEQHEAIAAETLAEIDPTSEEAILVLVELLARRGFDTPQSVFDAFKEIGAPAVPALVELFTDVDSPSRVVATFALGRIGVEAREAVPALIAGLVDDDRLIRPPAASAVDSIRAGFLDGIEFNLTGQAADDAVAILIRALHDNEHWVRTTAADVLGSAGPLARSAVPSLVESLEDSHPHVRTKAIKVLVKIDPDDTDMEPHLLHALNDDNQYVRTTVVVGIGDLGIKTDQAIAALITALRDDYNHGRNQAARVLGEFRTHPETVIPALAVCRT
jgi:HEAT repeat protein